MSNSSHGKSSGSFLCLPRSGPCLYSHFAVTATLLSLVEVVFGGGDPPEGLLSSVAWTFGGGEADITTVLLLGVLPVFGGGEGNTAVATAFLGVNTALASVEYCLGVLAPAGAAPTLSGMADAELELDGPAVTVLADVGRGVDGGVGLSLMARRTRAWR